MSNSNSASAPRKQASPADIAAAAKILAQKNNARVAASTGQQEKFADITKTNAFAQIMLNSALSPEAKRDEMVKALTFSSESTKEENRAKLEAFAQFKEYLQEQRKLLNREGIKLQDTEAFAELQSVIDDMTKASIDFQEKVRPLIEVLSAVFEIRNQNKIIDVYQEIQLDKAWQEEQTQALANLEADLNAKERHLENLEREAARLSEERSFFGFGPVRESAKARIAEIESVDKVAVAKELDELVVSIESQKQILHEGRGSENPDLLAQKEVLRGFLDLKKDENRERQKDLINAAVHYVDTSDTRLKQVLNTLGRLGKHAEVVGDTNGMLKNIHVVMDEALRVANKSNMSLKDQFVASLPDESSIARMTREEKLSDLNEHISQTDEGAVDIANSIGGLTKHAVQIQAYKDTLRNESSSTKRLHLEGVSQMGEQLMSVISAISAAATSESRSVAANNFARMSEQNQSIISQEVVRNATNIEIEANQIAKLVGELQDYGDVLQASSEIANHGYSRLRETVDAIKKVSGSVQQAIHEMVSDRSEAGIAVGVQPEGHSTESNGKSNEQEQPGFENPFDRLTRSSL